MSLRRFVGPLSEAPTNREPFTKTWMPSPVFVIPKKQPNFWLEEALETAGNAEVLEQVKKKRTGWRFIVDRPPTRSYEPPSLETGGAGSLHGEPWSSPG